ncbi:MAG: septation protein SepH [Actinomycetia bacterium]|nr:septation protein SepH [Actinomycetes bacterium]
MEDLRLVGLSEDGSRLVLEGADGQEFAVCLDERLHAALRGDRARLGQLQIAMESQLRPREIQARIRAGQSSEEVALAAGVSVDRIRRFETPIMLERTHMAETARSIGVRRVTDATTTPLGTLVAARLEERGVDPLDLEWDSWRREDACWQVVLHYTAGERERVASWVFDPARRTIEPADEEARWLTEEERAVPERVRPLHPRLTPVPAPEPDEETAQRDTGPVVAPAAPSEPAPPAAKPEPKSGRRRASVPSWDEILFGGPVKPEGS